MSNINWGAVVHWILSYLAISWIFFVAAVLGFLAMQALPPRVDN